MRRLFEGGVYSGAASIRVNTVYHEEIIYSRVLLNNYRIITRRKTRNIGLDALRKDICCVFSKESVDDLDDVITAYDNTLRIMTSTPQNKQGI